MREMLLPLNAFYIFRTLETVQLASLGIKTLANFTQLPFSILNCYLLTGK